MKYTAVYSRDADGRWHAALPTLRGWSSHGRALATVRRLAREALDVAHGTDAEMVERFELKAATLAALDRVRKLRSAAERAEAALMRRQRAAAAALAAAGISSRDAGEIMGLSHERVRQLASE